MVIAVVVVVIPMLGLLPRNPATAIVVGIELVLVNMISQFCSKCVVFLAVLALLCLY